MVPPPDIRVFVFAVPKNATLHHFSADPIPKMMYVSGETGEPSVETTGIIEDIVRQQVVELVRIVVLFLVFLRQA